MKTANFTSFLYMAVAASVLAGCQSGPRENLKNYAVIESRIGTEGADMDANPNLTAAQIRAIDLTKVPPGPLVNLPPGSCRVEFGTLPDDVSQGRATASEVYLPPGPCHIEVQLHCAAAAACRPGKPFDLVVEAGKRYVLKPDGVYVSDRFESRRGEVLYQSAKQDR